MRMPILRLTDRPGICPNGFGQPCVQMIEVKELVAHVRVYELAKELNMSNHDVIAALTEMGIEGKSHASSLEEDVVVKLKERFKGGSPTVTAERPVVSLPQDLSVRKLADLLDVSTADIQKALVSQGALVGVNQVIAPNLAMKVAESFGYDVIIPEPVKVKAPKPQPKPEPTPVAPKVEAPQAPKAPAEPKPKAEGKPQPKRKPERVVELQPRPPVVTILGHVDHGKTTLLDAIRESKVVDQEFGGITQHIGAYQVDIRGRKITFLDTPGHEAFTAMRARGAQVTDIAILIVAADDGVMPQTIEAIDHAKAAGVHIIAAINKIDKVDANVDRTKQQLAEHGLVIEEWGGDTVSVSLSAKSRLNLEELLDMILLVADLAELKADPHAPVEATVVEAQLDRGKGPIATVLVQAGTLKIGDSILVGQAYGRIRAMLDDSGKRIQKAGPATPVEIVGLSSVPLAGDKLEVIANEKEARQIAEARAQEERTEKLGGTQRITLADLYKQLKEGTVKDLNLILKSDVQGSAEAIRQSLERLSTSEVRVKLIHSGIGNIGESDILLASASNAVVIGFNIRVDNPAKAAAEAEKIDVRTYNVIYELLDEVTAAMEGLLEPEIRETVTGHAEVRQLFRLPKGGSIAGSYVTDGKLQRSSQARILRGGQVIHTGKLASLKHLKEDVREIAAGFECGIMVDGFNTFNVGDIIEVFIIEEIARRIR